MTDDPPLTNYEKDTFKQIADGISDDTANKLLNHHVGRVRMWLRKSDANGYEPSLSDLVRQVRRARIPKGRMTVAFAAALWRLARQEEDKSGHR